MNENIERVLAELDGFRMCNQMDYDAYSRLHDGISELDDLLKAQELPPVKPEKLEERTTKWLDKMTAEERLKEIAAILNDWDGYRTAKGLGGLINEIWAYALYPVKAQEPVKPVVDVDTWTCGHCGHTLEHQELLGDNVLFHEQYDYCPMCGKKVMWE